MLLQFALERASLVRVPLNMRFTRHEVATILQDCEAAAVFHDAATADRVAELADAFGALWWCPVDSDGASQGPTWAALLASADELPPFAADDALASINTPPAPRASPRA
jgi:acyl-CoA synthetase (AMP-forming)/AMP-acid ligase II